MSEASDFVLVNRIGIIVILTDWTCVDVNSFRTIAIGELPVS